MQASDSGLNRLQINAIEGLLTTSTRAEAAKAAGCSERSIYKWLSNPMFAAELTRRENVLRREVGRRITQDANQALDLLQDFMSNNRVDDRLRLRAAQLWLDYLIKTQDQTELLERITRLEASKWQKQ